jgi:acid phosphatase type 7
MRAATVCLACAAILCTSGARADEAAPLLVGPYVQNVQGDGFTIVFDTVQPVHATVTAAGQSVDSDGTHHVARLEKLKAPKAGQRVVYRVTVDGKLAGEGSVALPAGVDRPLTFVVYGDTRDNEIGATLVDFARRLSPELILYTGDLVRAGGNVKYWNIFFHDEQPLLGDVPLYPTIGNHELFHDPLGTNAEHYFALPPHPPGRFYYTFDRGPARFIVLDGNHVDDAQTQWLSDMLDGADKDRVRHVFVMLHQPPLSVGPHCGAATVQEDWVALFERHRVRAVFAGHDHAYERMERNGVRYFVSGGGGAELYREGECAEFDAAARRVYLAEHHLLRVSVSGETVTVEALPIDGGAGVPQPLDVVRFAAGEPMFAGDAPLLRPSRGRGRVWPIVGYGGGGLACVLVALFIRRRYARCNLSRS